MGKGEKIKVAFLGNAVIKKVVPDQVYRDRLTALLQSARTKLAAAKTELETLPPDNETRITQLATHGQLVADVAAEETRGQTDPAMIGMAEAMAGSSMDTATMARMLQMRGEILKAIGDIMLRHGQAMAVEK